MTTFKRFISYYVRSTLPFLSGIAFGIFLIRWDHPLWLQVLAGLTLVVVGPFVIRLVLTLFVEALRGVPESRATGMAGVERPGVRLGIHERRLERNPQHPVGTIQTRPAVGPFGRNR